MTQSQPAGEAQDPRMVTEGAGVRRCCCAAASDKSFDSRWTNGPCLSLPFGPEHFLSSPMAKGTSFRPGVYPDTPGRKLL